MSMPAENQAAVINAINAQTEALNNLAKAFDENTKATDRVYSRQRKRDFVGAFVGLVLLALVIVGTVGIFSTQSVNDSIHTQQVNNESILKDIQNATSPAAESAQQKTLSQAEMLIEICVQNHQDRLSAVIHHTPIPKRSLGCVADFLP